MDLSLPQIWLIVGLVMLLAELVSVTLVFIFFAVGAFATALLAILGIVNEPDTQIMCFSVISFLSLILLRKQAKLLFFKGGKSPEYNEFIGETAMVIREIPQGGEGKIFYRGAEWIATSSHHQAIEAGSKVIIRNTDGIKLIVDEA